MATELCVCLQQCPCAANEYFNQNSCSCECVENATCPNQLGKDYYWSSTDCSCKCVPHPELCVSDSQSDSVWNTLDCECQCIEKGVDWCENYGNSLLIPRAMYFNENTCACSFLEMGCPVNFFWNQEIGECSCVI